MLQVLNISIALIFIFLIFSLFVTEIQEQVAALFEFRSHSLRASIERILGENSRKEKKPLTEAVYNTSIFKATNNYAVFSLKHLIDVMRRKSSYSAGPEEISAESFVEAILEVIQGRLEKKPPASTLASTDKITKIINKLENLDQEQEGNKTLTQIARAVQLQKVDAGLQDFRDELAQRFNSTALPATIAYRRNAKGLSLFIGMVLAVVLNINTLHIVETLTERPELTDEIVAAVVNNLSDCEESGDSGSQVCLEQVSEFRDGLLEDQSFSLEGLIGRTEGEQLHWIPRTSEDWSQLLGWSLTAIALSMGAPFWFNLLNKVINLRNPFSSRQPKPSGSPDSATSSSSAGDSSSQPDSSGN